MEYKRILKPGFYEYFIKNIGPETLKLNSGPFLKRNAAIKNEIKPNSSLNANLRNAKLLNYNVPFFVT